MEMLRFYRVDLESAEQIYDNIKLCADDMAKKGMVHWIPYYSVEKIKEDIEKNIVFMIDFNKVNVGNFILIPNNNILYISKFAIIPEYENKGIGTKSLKFIEKYAKSEGVKILELDVYDKSIGAICFYEKNGYKIIGEKPTRRFKVKIMQKELK